MKKIIRLSETDLTRIVKKVIREEKIKEDLGGMEDSHPIFGNMNLSKYSERELDDMLYSRKRNSSNDENEIGDDYHKCSYCNGKGYDEMTDEECEICNGTGSVI
jgi:DnaJ-class molecular chaperone